MPRVKWGWALGLLGAAAWAQTVPPEKGSQPGWDAGTAFESALTRCRACHDRDSAEAAPLYMPFDGWVSSMMGNAQRDPVFRAAVAVANQDIPNVGQWCLRCHSPQAYVTGHVLPADGGALEAIDYEGVTCDVCHRSIIPPDEPGAPFVGNAQLYFEPSVKKLGPYPNLINSAHEGEQSSFTASSELCGQCHSVHNPVGAWHALDGGQLGARFPLDTTYEEWKQSYAGILSCADCHLPRYSSGDGGIRIAKRGDPRLDPPQHVLVGGNVWGLDAVQAANPALATEFADQFAATRERTLENLRAAATLELLAPREQQTGDVATVKVRVTNRSGHKLPTGYADGRRVVVQLLVDGVVVSGGFDGGALLGDSQLRVYEAVHGRAGKGPEEHLVLHDAVLKDSRIPPLGFVPTLLTRPVGVAWFDAADGGVNGFDEAPFTVALPTQRTAGAKVKVTARLLYQSTTPEYVAFLAQENRTDLSGQRLSELYAATGKGPPIEMARAEGELTLAAGPGSMSTPRPCGCGSTPGAFSVAVLLGLWRRGLRRSLRNRWVFSKN